MNNNKRLAILIGGSDLFLGTRGISRGTKVIYREINDLFEEIILVNYNYFLDGGRSLKKLYHHIREGHQDSIITLYGYSKGGDVVLQLARLLEPTHSVHLLITIDIANGPWSHKIERSIPSNVKKTINVFQRQPSFPLRSHGMAAYSSHRIPIENIDLTGRRLDDKIISHTNIEWLMIKRVVDWLKQ